jgi:hypothetical protein
MQFITDDLRRILSSRFGAGADGFHSRVTLPDSVLTPVTGSAWNLSALYGCTPSATLWGSLRSGDSLGWLVDASWGPYAYPFDAIHVTDNLNWSGSTQYDTFTFPVAQTFSALTIVFGTYSGFDNPNIWEVLADGAPVAGSWTLGDADGWASPPPSIHYSWYTWRPTASPAVAATSIAVRRVLASRADSWTFYDLVEILVRGMNVTPVTITGITRISIDKSLQTDADAFEIEIALD